ncbi:histone deacetylase complex subunit SAP25 isoform X2 [Dromiciops gliroides]|uniref:histone deacetylase complex subunit SAP25 isoform X2 n=1 Tax=Dromiciops gliroides TaxID=33562 RepID=UPI001CC67E63|nr:histone deacetylase complex subunit SAP25 isoform X2 [Dromiciops gliroides]
MTRDYSLGGSPVVKGSTPWSWPLFTRSLLLLHLFRNPWAPGAASSPGAPRPRGVSTSTALLSLWGKEGPRDSPGTHPPSPPSFPSMIPCLPPGGGEEDRDKDPSDQEEDCGSGEESLGDTGIPRPYSPEPGSPSAPASQLHRDPIQPPSAMLHFGQKLLGHQIPVLTQSLKEGSQPNPWEPAYEKGAAGNSGSGNSISFRTIWHPSFCALFDAQGHDSQCLAPPEVEGNRESSQGDKGFPALCSEDFFFSDPLLPSITRIPLGLSQSPQQILKRSRQLLAPPPIMSVWTPPTPAPILTWRCGPEITAVTCLLEMSQGEVGGD